MVKKLLSKVSRWSVALFLVEWSCFIAGIVLDTSVYVKLTLLTAARVLPSALFARYFKTSRCGSGVHDRYKTK